MLPNYSDITSRLGEPLWWDEHGVPRYEPFHPQWCDVYANYAALILIACQNCGREFIVGVSVSETKHAIFHRASIELPTPNSLGSFYYGDPPRHAEEGVCLAGDTMTSVPKRVLEFWHRPLDRIGDWHRLPEYEFEIEEEWD